MQPAVICGERVWNYRELDEWSSRTAAYLQLQHNVGPNTRVGVYMERRVELIPLNRWPQPQSPRC